ncbi:putative Serine/threonine protein phosphatase 2A regulatory subunit B''beta [Paratrimastix pyriformis]|uniref:Serine/threonine protein phosphatase 2A regulatory subunit B''beta n=1 Tax=Paratrimastix pyriformis TaxID=342808 RepID=A0ABQ8UUH0_9EUKA|nr:putative Serine/threonine protein phosphatase 2A regulatory subunit B''beta [Paratrimastix pyriformis]
MTLPEIRRSNLFATCLRCDDEPDINKILFYFSYEHFYVLYCKFWELDSDHDQFIGKADLARYGTGALSQKTLDRIFTQIPRKFASTRPGTMCYDDFIWFLLSEEDKTTDTSLTYWFRLCDLDGDGVISAYEMEYFYEEQEKRLAQQDSELVKFSDILTQMTDMIHPVQGGRITLADLKRCKLGNNLFNILTNVTKFIIFETRDPFGTRPDTEFTDWDRFAQVEYEKLASEEAPLANEEAPQDVNDAADLEQPAPALGA